VSFCAVRHGWVIGPRYTWAVMRLTDRFLVIVPAILALGLAPRLPAEEPTPEAAAAPPISAAPVTAADPAVAVPPADAATETDAAATTPVAATAGATVAAVASITGASAADQRGFAEADRLVVHKSKRRLELLKDGAVIAEYPIRLGLNPAGHKMHEGDFRTPEGHYYLSRRNPRSDYFLAIEVSYPNDADRRRARGNGKQPGGSIMIHGLPNVPRKTADYYTRNDWTDGCIAVSNSDMVDIWLRTQVGLPIDIRP
jgi:L,D-transpeptidase catalytic domain